MAAIPKEPEKTAVAECIQCLHCENICPQDAISFKPGAAFAGYSGALDLTRRGIFLSLGAGALATMTLKTSPFTKLCKSPAAAAARRAAGKFVFSKMHPLRGVHESLPHQYPSALPLGKRA